MDELIAQVNDGEPTHHSRVSTGWIEVIAGSMFSGKSEELICRLRPSKTARQKAEELMRGVRRAKRAGRKVRVFKREVDSRYSNDHIVPHSEMRHESANSRS